MNEKEFETKLAKGEIKEREIPKKETPEKDLGLEPLDIESYERFLNLLKQLKSFGSSVPTHTPRSFIEQIYFYVSGATRGVYFWFNNAWIKTPLEYVELPFSLATRVTTANVWEDWDVSAVVPAGAKYVNVNLSNHDAANTRVMGIREKGSGLARLPIGGLAIQGGMLSMIAILNSDRIIERRAASNLSCWFEVMGYWI